MKVKLLYVVSTLQNLGPTNQLFNIISNLDFEQVEATVLTLSPEKNNSLIARFSCLPITIVQLSALKPISFFSTILKARAFLKDNCFDVIHSQGIRPDIVSALRFANYFSVTSVRNYPQLDYVMKYGCVVGGLMKFTQGMAFRRIDKCVAVSKAVKNNAEKLYGLTNVVRILNGVDNATHKRANKKEKHELRKKHLLDENCRIWVCSGEVSVRKNCKILIDLWLRKYAGDKSNLLLLAGDGPQLEEYRQLSEGNSNIVFLGFVDDMPEIYRLSDFYISSSLAEGMPNAALEAMSAGLPIFVSDIEPHKEIFEISSEVGRLFSNGDLAGISNGIDWMLSQDYQSMSDAAHYLARNQLSAKSMSENYGSLYLDNV